jgi:Down syndrome cell adhesion molecule-like protein 1
MRGNSAIIKCLIPSFVADFVQVVAWINEDKEEIFPGKDFSGGKERCSFSHQSFSNFPYNLNFHSLLHP